MTFTAQFNGLCERCDHPIVPGQSIRGTALSGGYVHVNCPKDHPVCQKCWLIHPPGDCE